MRTTITLTLMGMVSSAMMFVYIASRAVAEEFARPAYANPQGADLSGNSSLTTREHSLQA